MVFGKCVVFGNSTDRVLMALFYFDICHYNQNIEKPLLLQRRLGLSASMLSKAKCLLMLLTNICSRVLQQVHVSENGSIIQQHHFSPSESYKCTKCLRESVAEY